MGATSFRVVTSGQRLVLGTVSAKDTGTTVPVFTDSALTLPVTFPTVLIADTTFWINDGWDTELTMPVSQVDGVQLVPATIRARPNFFPVITPRSTADQDRADVSGFIVSSVPGYAPKKIRPSSVIDHIQTGHGWTVTGTPAVSNLNDTSNFTVGSQSLTLTTNGAAAYSFVNSPNPISPVFDTTAKAIRVWCWISDITQVAELTFWACIGASFANTYTWDCISYANTSNNSVPQSGEWFPITLPFSFANTTGAPTRTSINRAKFQVKDKGTGAFSFAFNGLEVVNDGSATYPNGLVTLSFDDSYASQAVLGKQTLDKYGFPATCYVICDNIGTSNRLTLAQLQSLQNVSGWEVAAHAYTQVNHDAGYDTLTPAQVLTEIAGSKRWLGDNGFNGGDDFAYPGGRWNSNVIATASQYFASGRSIYGQNSETIPPANPIRIRAQQPSSGTTTASINTLLDNATANKSWLPLAFHDIVNSGASGVQYTQANFDTVCAHILANGMAVRTYGQALRME